ncbi:zinc-binding dehydrogenase [Streptomyces pseudoechinosporeus]
MPRRSVRSAGWRPACRRRSATTISAGQLRPVIDSRFALEDFEDGYARLASREAIGSIVVEF